MVPVIFSGSAYRMRNLLISYVLLLVWSYQAVAQFVGPQTHFSGDRRQLSPQQQGHILSDIQQHHHRFNVPNTASQFGSNNQQFNRQQFPPFPPNQASSNQFQSQSQPQSQSFFNQQFNPNQQFNSNQQVFHPQATFNQNDNFRPTQQFQNNNNPSFSQPTAIPTSQSVVPHQTIVSNPVRSQQSNVLSTSQPAEQNNVVQHHTQTRFTPQFNSGPASTVDTPQQSVFQQRPTIEPSLSFSPQPVEQIDPEKEKQRLKELKEKQAIIDKHNKFVERQYEKSLQKAQSDHALFVQQQREQKKKLYQKLYKPSQNENLRYTVNNPRYIYPEEAQLFNKAVEQYYIEHPTTTTTTTTTTTPAPTTLEEEYEEEIDDEEENDRAQEESVRAQEETERPVKISKPSFLPTALPSAESKIKKIQSLEDLNQLKKQYRQQQIKKDDLLAQLRLAIGGNLEDELSKNISSREISLRNGERVQLLQADPQNLPEGQTEEITLPNGQKVKIIKTDDPDAIATAHSNPIPATGRSDTRTPLKTQEITLPNGERVEVIKTNDPNLVPDAMPLEPGSDLEKLVFSMTTTPRPTKEIIDELTKGVVPPGSDFELLKTGATGGFEQVGGTNIPNQKKVTFVLLEEQSDGTLKVQGVKANGKDKSNLDVDSILKKIKNGEIKLPPVSKTTSDPTSPTPTRSYKKYTPSTYTKSEEVSSTPVLKTNIGTHFVATSTPSSTYYTKIFSSTQPRHTTTRPPRREPSRGTRKPHILNRPVSNNDLIHSPSSTSVNHNSIYTTSFGTTLYEPRPTVPSSAASVSIQQSVTQFLTTTPLPEQSIDRNAQLELPEILKRSGLFAMAKFLKESGLDTILNETGPYTIFAPTDKAFRTLLIQLGGPERAEEKFKENPRLLSGLLLHHVIPGAFTIDSLQDEMTGVSLAGTQLRVNQYNMHDQEWNDVKVTTINGAKILEDKRDIEIPQGTAHAIDRVMFPLPVGDIVQTLQSDRERRFTSFLRAIFASGMAETLQGTKTFTLFAPTDRAFTALSTEDLRRTVTDKTLARELVLRHMVQGTLYTNGMRYYQLKDTLQQDKQITLSKQTGKVKVNNAQIATQNIPATNGVIHAIDVLL